MLDIKQFRELLVKPVLTELQQYSLNAEELLVFTCAAESDGGTYLKQKGGPALGIYQCEPATHNDIWRNYIVNRHQIVSILGMNFGVTQIPQPERMITDLRYATAICRIHYLRVKGALPDCKDVDAIWDYYKIHYNTVQGKASKSNAIKAYERFIA